MTPAFPSLISRTQVSPVFARAASLPQASKVLQIWSSRFHPVGDDDHPGIGNGRVQGQALASHDHGQDFRFPVVCQITPPVALPSRNGKNPFKSVRFYGKNIVETAIFRTRHRRQRSHKHFPEALRSEQRPKTSIWAVAGDPRSSQFQEILTALPIGLVIFFL